MIVHVVKPGDTLWKIAQRYRTSVSDVVALNYLPDTTIVPGLSLLIPSTVRYTIFQYQVRSGDTWWKIAQKFSISLSLLIAANQMPRPTGLMTGDILLVPRIHTGKPTIETHGYLISTGTVRDRELLNQFRSYLTYVSIFTYRINENGDVIRPPVESFYKGDLKILLNLSNTLPNGTFSSSVVHQILVDQAKRKKVIDFILLELGRMGWFGVDLDLEHLYPEDRSLYIQFVSEIRDALKPHGYFVTIDIPPKPFDNPQNEWVGAFDYHALGGLADRVMLMTYDWGFPQGRPQAIAPVDKIKQVLDYATSIIDPQKILMGFPLYAYDWPLPHSPSKPAHLLVNQAAKELAIKELSTIQIGTDSVSPYFYYYKNNVQRVVWFNDALTILAKFELINSYKLKGFFVWALGYDFPETWSLLQDHYQVR